MNDRELQAIIADDQRETELSDTAKLTADYYRTLVTGGLPGQLSEELTQTFHSLMLSRHFDIDLNKTALLDFVTGEG